MPSPSDYPVEVTLRSIDGRDEHYERKILLAPDSKVHIGRSSKSPSKNLFSTPNNAYIDSPVVSRDHATLSCNSSCGISTIYLTDCESMHGTLVNKVRLEAKKAHLLRNGDLLQFGNDVVRDNESFHAKKFVFESKPAVKPLQEPDTSFRTFEVPDAETSEEDEEDFSDDDISVVQSVDGKLGSQANPVSIMDDNDGPAPARTEDKKERQPPAVPGLITIDFSSEDDRESISSHYSDSDSEQESHGYKFQSYVEDAEDDLEEAHPCEAPASAKKDTRVASADHEVSFDVEDKSESATRHSPTPNDASKGQKEALFDESSDSDKADSLAHVKNDPRACLKMLEMLKAASDVREDQATCHAIDHTASEVRIPEAIQGTAVPKLLMKAAPSGEKDHGPSSDSATCFESPSRPMAVPMSLRNIMAPDKENTPSPRSSESKGPSRPMSNCTFTAATTESWTPKPMPPKECDIKSSAFEYLDYPEMYESPWNSLPAPPRPSAPKHVTWGSDPLASDPFWSEPRISNLAPLPMSDPPRVFRTIGESSFENYPGCYPYSVPASLHASLPTLTSKTSLATPPSAPDHLFVNATPPQLTDGFAPAARFKTPPPSKSSEKSRGSLPSPSSSLKAKTGISIPEIVENVHPPTPTSVNSLKRKADVFDSEETEAVTEEPMTLELTKSSIKNRSSPVPVTVSVEHRPKRMRLQLAASAVAGAVIGGIGVLGALATLPESFFQ